MVNTLPTQVVKYFWGDDLNELRWEKHQRYIVQTLLENGDTASINWLFKQISRQQIKQMLPSLQLSPKSKNFWDIYLS